MSSNNSPHQLNNQMNGSEQIPNTPPIRTSIPHNVNQRSNGIQLQHNHNLQQSPNSSLRPTGQNQSTNVPIPATTTKTIDIIDLDVDGEVEIQLHNPYSPVQDNVMQNIDQLPQVLGSQKPIQLEHQQNQERRIQIIQQQKLLTKNMNIIDLSEIQPNSLKEPQKIKNPQVQNQHKYNQIKLIEINQIHQIPQIKEQPIQIEINENQKQTQQKIADPKNQIVAEILQNETPNFQTHIKEPIMVQNVQNKIQIQKQVINVDEQDQVLMAAQPEKIQIQQNNAIQQVAKQQIIQVQQSVVAQSKLQQQSLNLNNVNNQTIQNNIVIQEQMEIQNNGHQNKVAQFVNQQKIVQNPIQVSNLELDKPLTQHNIQIQQINQPQHMIAQTPQMQNNEFNQQQPSQQQQQTLSLPLQQKIQKNTQNCVQFSQKNKKQQPQNQQIQTPKPIQVQQPKQTEKISNIHPQQTVVQSQIQNRQEQISNQVNQIICFTAQSPQLTDINEIRKLLLKYLPPHLKELTQTLADQQLRQMYLQIRAQELRAAAIQNGTHEQQKKSQKAATPIQNNNQQQANKKKQNPKPNEHKKSQPLPRIQQKKPVINSTVNISIQPVKPVKRNRKQKKRVVTTVVQQIQYYQDSDNEQPSKCTMTENGQLRKKKPANKAQMQAILTQLCSLVKSLDLTALGGTTN